MTASEFKWKLKSFQNAGRMEIGRQLVRLMAPSFECAAGCSLCTAWVIYAKGNHYCGLTVSLPWLYRAPCNYVLLKRTVGAFQIIKSEKRSC